MTSDCQTQFSFLSQNERLAFSCGFILVSVSATFLNGTAAFLFIKVKSLRSFSNALIISLIIADIFVGSVTSPLTVAILLLPTNKQSCALNKTGTLASTLLAVTALTVCGIAYDRFKQITRVSDYKHFMSYRRKIFLLVAPWIAPLLLTPARWLDERSFTWVVISLYISAIAMLVGTSKLLFRFLGKRMEQLSHFDDKDEGIHTRTVIARQNQRAIRVILLVIGAFCVCTLLHLCYRLLLTVHMYRSGGWEFFRSSGPLVFAASQLTFQLNSVLNPLLYFAKHSGIKQAMKDVCILRRSRSVQVRSKIRVFNNYITPEVVGHGNLQTDVDTSRSTGFP